MKSETIFWHKNLNWAESKRYEKLNRKETSKSIHKVDSEWGETA